MYSVTVMFNNRDQEELLCASKPSIEIEGDFILINGGQGQKLAVGIAALYKIKISAPLPDKLAPFKYSVDVHYSNETDDTEMWFAVNEVYTKVEVSDTRSIVFIKESDNVVRVINGQYLRSVKVNTYSEAK